MQGEDELFSQHMNERLGELLDNVSALLVWVLRYAKENNLPIEGSLEFLTSRIQTILEELGEPPNLTVTIGAPVRPLDHPIKQQSTLEGGGPPIEGWCQTLPRVVVDYVNQCEWCRERDIKH